MSNSNMPARDFSEALAYLGSKVDRPYKPSDGGSPRSTRVVKTESGVGIKYHDTVVIEYTPEGLRLDSGNFRTVTTKARINEAIGVLPGHVSVSQNRGIWYVHTADRNPKHTDSSVLVNNPNFDPTLPRQNYHFDGADSNWEIAYMPNPDHDPDQPYWINSVVMPYFDGVIIGWDGKIKNAPKDNGQGEIERIEKLTKQINAYVKHVIATIDRVHAMTEDNYDPDVLPPPSGGDCWHCVMKNAEGKTLGDLSGDDHLIAHMEESYVVPSLLWNALQEFGSRYSRGSLQALMEGNGLNDFEVDHLKRMLNSSVCRYLKIRLGVGR